MTKVKAWIEGPIPDLIAAGGGQRYASGDLTICYSVSKNGTIRNERIVVPAAYRYDGTSRPAVLGWLVPRWGSGAIPSRFHDWCFTEGPILSTGERISRKESDLVWIALEFRYSNWAAVVAAGAYHAVHIFGEPVWNAHDFRKS